MDNAALLEGLNAPEAKRRERTFKSLSPQAMQDAQVIEALQKLVSSDPVEYVREAACHALVVTGQTPASSVAPIQLKIFQRKQSFWILLGVILIGWAIAALFLAGPLFALIYWVVSLFAKR